MNPYSNANFFEFFAILFQRMGGLLFGQELTLVSDEIQICVLASCAIACGLIGPFVVLKRMAMFANSLSHTTLIGVVGAYLFTSYFFKGGFFDLKTLFLGALLSALLTGGLIELISRCFRLQEDAATGLIFTFLFAAGVILVTLFTRNIHLSTEAVIGNCDVLQRKDFFLASASAIFNFMTIFFFYRRFLLISFDESYANTLGIMAAIWRFILFFMTSMTCMAAFRSIGVLVVLGLIVGPYLTCRMFCKKLHRLFLWTSILGVVECVCGVALSRSILTTFDTALSTGGLISLEIVSVFFFAAFIRFLYQSFQRKFRFKRVHLCIKSSHVFGNMLDCGKHKM